MNDHDAQTTKPDPSPASEQDGAVKSARRVLLIIELLTRHPRGLTFVKIQEHLSIPRSSLHNLLRTMSESGHLAFDEESRQYRLGVRYWEAGQAFMRGLDLAGEAERYLEAARDELNETVQLAVLDGVENVYIGKVEADQRLQLVSEIGSRLPAHATGLGKVLLADLDEAELRRRLEPVRLEPFTEATVTETDDLVAHLEEVRRRGYAIDRGEYTAGVFCVAVPVRDHSGRSVAAMSSSVPTVRVSTEMEQRMLEVLSAQATKLSEALGYRPSRRAEKEER